jgi:hypothetical protein
MAGESEADQRVLDQMKVMLTAVEFAEGTGFAEIIDWLRIQTKLSIDVNWPALALANIERTTDTGGLALRDVKAETMLEILLGKVGAASGGIAKLGWQVVDGVVRISTIDDLNTRTIVRIYDCQDLIGESATPLQRALLDTMAKHARAGTASTRPSPANASKAIEQALPSDPQALAEALSNSRAEDVDTFVDMIISTIEPGSWAPEGTLGSICEYDGLLIVRHSWRTQQQIVKLLNNLRQAKAARSAGVAGTRPAADSRAEHRGQTSARDLLPSILCVYS